MKEREIRDKVIREIRSRRGFHDFNILADSQFSDNKKSFLVDIVFSKPNNHPHLIVKIGDNIDPLTIDQLLKVMILSHAKYGMISNGKNNVFYFQNSPKNIIEIPDLPCGGTDSVEFRKDKLNAFYNLYYKLQKIVWLIADDLRNRGLGSQEVLSVIQKILLCKIVDEKSPQDSLLFFIDPIPHKGGSSDASRKISQLFQTVKQEYPNIFGINETLDLSVEL